MQFSPAHSQRIIQVLSPPCPEPIQRNRKRSYPNSAHGILSQCVLDEPDRRVRIIHFHDQFAVPLVMQVNDDGFLRVMHVPKDSLTVLIEGSRCDDSGHVGSRHPNAVIPATCLLRVCSNARNVDERDFVRFMPKSAIDSTTDFGVKLEQQSVLGSRWRLDVEIKT
jgi:hypothetical protein